MKKTHQRYEETFKYHESMCKVQINIKTSDRTLYVCLLIRQTVIIYIITGGKPFKRYKQSRSHT